jgi:hypothetical protein
LRGDTCRYSRETGVGVLIDFGLAEVREGLADELVEELKANKNSAKEEEVISVFFLYSRHSSSSPSFPICRRKTGPVPSVTIPPVPALRTPRGRRVFELPKFSRR